jgi:putative membrane-bound dehydrogenase-like protein
MLAGCSRSGSRSLHPKEALASFRLSEDFRVTLFAAEPMVLDPVDMVFDEYGRAYVADMLDLPYDPPAGKLARSRIVRLEDNDGDGRADKSTVFAENVLQVSGLLVWNGGLIVPSAPHIYFMKDTDGDGKADVREILFTGFYQGNPEAQITNPRLAIDNWIYFSNTGNAGRITSPKFPNHPPVEVRGMDFRYHPRRHSGETASGAAQYGSAFDDWGNRFISQNTIHLRHVVAPAHYLRRALLLETPGVNHDPYGSIERLMWPLTPPQQWRVQRTELRQQRYDELKTGRTEHVAGHITGATGGTVFNGDAWPAEYRGSIFTGDVSGNLVRRDILTADGVSFRARPAKEGVEFLASTDPWFRPACFANAPDGHLYMMDMYREVIETPLSIPEEIQKRLSLDFYRGDAQGRIYRIEHRQPRQNRPLAVKLGDARPEELVAALAHENGWHRQTAQRLLVERQIKSVAPLLRAMARENGNALAGLHALWTIEGVGSLEESDVLAALNDAHAGIREQAVRLSESLAVTASMEKALLAKARDPEIRVLHQLAYTLGRYDSAAVKQTVAALAAAHAGNQWMRVATLVAAANWPGDMLRLLAANKQQAWQHRDLLRTLGSTIGVRRNPAEVTTLLSVAGTLTSPEHALEGLARGLAASNAASLSVPGSSASLERFLGKGDAAARAAWSIAAHLDVPGLHRRAVLEAENSSLDIARRVAAVSALRGAPFARVLPVLKKLLAGNTGQAQSAAIDALAAFPGTDPVDVILAGWPHYSPEARGKAIAATANQGSRTPLLLDAIEKGVIDAALVDTGIRSRLMEDSDSAVGARARKIFGSAVSERDKVVAQFREVAALPGDALRGRKVFEEHCAKCHTARRGGGRAGPDLSGVNNKTREELLEAILNPSRAIEPRYVNYIVTTNEGLIHDGVLAAETPAAITLRGGDVDDVTILRTNIREVRASRISLMPEDFEKSMSKQALADVIVFLRAGM